MTAREWTAATDQHSMLWDSLGAAVVIGADPDHAAHLALAIAREQSKGRRVAIGDLVGNLPLLATVGDADALGLSDSLVYGVSLNRVARRADDVATLFVMPSGTEVVATPEVYGSARWRRIAAGFRDAGALLLLVALPDVPGLDALVDATDGVIVAGDVSPPAASWVIARIAVPTADTSVSAPRSAPVAPPVESPAESSVPQLVEPPLTASVAREAAEPVAPPAAATVAPHVADAVAPVEQTPLVVRRPRPALSRTPAPPASRSSAHRMIIVAAAVVVGVVLVVALRRATLDGARTVTAGGSDGSASSIREQEVPKVLNPSDSGSAAAFAIELSASNTSIGAFAGLQHVQHQPAATIAPGFAGPDFTWYRVVVGAYATRAEAESLLVALLQDGIVTDSSNRVRRLPYALLLAQSIAVDSIGVRAAEFHKLGVPAYALLQIDGSARLFAGAFAMPEEALTLAPLVRNAGVEPVIVFRIGRAF